MRRRENLRGYIVEDGTDTFAMVPWPGTKPQMWARVHICVMLGSCRQCGAFEGQPCANPRGAPTVGHHKVRSKYARPNAQPETVRVKVVYAGELTFVDLEALLKGPGNGPLAAQAPDSEAERRHPPGKRHLFK